MHTEKKCRVCGMLLPLTDFYRNQLTLDGHLNTCRNCCKVYRIQNRERLAELNRNRKSTPDGKRVKVRADKVYREKYPEKVKARGAVKTAIESGKLIRQPCQFCGNTKSQAHHDDYNKPLDVKWVCRECHLQRYHNPDQAQVTFQASEDLNESNPTLIRRSR